MNTLEKLTSIFGQSTDFVVDGKLLKNKIVESALKMDKTLLTLIASDEQLKATFFTDIGSETVVFDKDKLVRFVSSKEFLPDSYTTFKKITGLFSDGQYLNGKNNKNVVLVWPYKDCVLEGGQSREDAKSTEIFWNEILAPDEVDQLLAPKVMTNFKRFETRERETGGDTQVVETTDFELQSTDNLIIKGNNLLALYSLKERFRGQIKLIYIDPPYNTGNDSFGYNDSFNHATWLTFMRNRLEIARELLTKDGVIFVSIDDDESHYLKVLMDEIFLRDNFVANVVWEKKYSPQNDAKWFSDNHDHILVYAKNKEIWRPNLLPRTDEQNKRYKNTDNDPRGPWKSSDLSVKTYSAEYDYPITTPSGKVVTLPYGRCWMTNSTKMQELINDNRIWFGESGENVPSLKRFLTEVKDGITPLTIWKYTDVGHTQEAKQEVNKLLTDISFGTPKPEKLIKRIIELSTKPGDIVLDYHLGSGTTAAVAHKMGRQYIGVEQMDYIETISIERLKKVLDGEQGGISQSVDWQGGGSFVYCELKGLNANYIDEIEAASTTDELNKIMTKILSDGYITYKINPAEFGAAFEQLESNDDKKRALIEVLDKNNLYVNYTEINDVDYNVTDEDKMFNKQFYGLKR